MRDQCNYHDLHGQCIFPIGHGGDHYYPNDSQDHSDEIRLRILRDNVAAHEATIAALTADNAALLELMRQALKAEYCNDPAECCTQWHDEFRKAFQSTSPGADLLKRHAEELASERGAFERLTNASADAIGELTIKREALRLQVEAAEAALRVVDDVLIVNNVGPRVDGDYRKALAELIGINLSETEYFHKQEAAALTKERDALRVPLEVFARAVPVVDSIPLADNEPVYVHRGNGSWLVCFVGAFRAAKAALAPPEDSSGKP